MFCFCLGNIETELEQAGLGHLIFPPGNGRVAAACSFNFFFFFSVSLGDSSGGFHQTLWAISLCSKSILQEDCYDIGRKR